MVYTVSVVVFAPNFPAGTPAEERIQELARSIQRCKDEEPFRKALDNEIGKQILSVATSKMEQLKKTMKTSASLADTWKKLKGADSSASLADTWKKLEEVEALVHTTGEAAAREVIVEEDLKNLRGVIVTDFLEVFFPPSSGEMGPSMLAWADGKFKEEAMQEVIANCSEVAACKSLLALHVAT